jgi:hypothetical protein
MSSTEDEQWGIALMVVIAIAGGFAKGLIF